MKTSIGEIGIFYGGLVCKEEDGKYFWSITDYSGDSWEEIPYYLYKALIKFNKVKTA